MLKKLTGLFLVLLSVTCSLFSQAGGTKGNDDNTVHVTATYLRRDIPLEVPDKDTFYRDALKDSVGFELGYMHFLGGNNKTGRNGWFGIGVEAGTSFSKVGKSRVAFGYGRGALQLQPRRHWFRPFVKGYVGVAGQDFGPANRVGTDAGGGLVFGGRERSLYLGGAGGIDWKVSKKLSLRLPEVDLGQTTFRPGKQWNAQVKAGLVVDF